MANTDDIRTTGPVGLKGLTEEQRRLMQEYLQSQQLARRAYARSLSPGAVNTTDIQRFSPDDPMASWGRSKYDNPVQPQYLTEGEMQDVRHENQSSWDVLANGVGKMLGKAGTTFVSSLVGIPYGIGTAIVEGRASGLWDNDVTSALANADKWMEENLKNYKSTEQEQAAWYDPVNLFSMNFLADDVITNAGFTLGAAAASAVGAGSLGLMSKAFNVVNNVSKADKIGKNVSNVLASLFSATGEGMIEAKQGVEERNKGALQALEQELAPEKNALALEEQQIHDEYEQTKGQSLMMTGDGGAVDPAWVTYQSKMEDLNERKAELQRKYDAGKQQIFESGRAMGNKILLGNQVLLTAGNLIQFGKAMSKSYDNARHAAVNTSKTMKPSWMKDGFNATAKNPNNLREGYEMSSKNFGRFRAATKGLITEGSEEMNQQLIQSISSAIYDEKDANDYWRAKLDRPSYREATKGMYTLGNIISQGFKDSWGDLDQWEQFVIGGLTGMSGTVMPSKIFNQDKSKSVFNPARYLSWEGGAWNAVKNFNEEYNKYAENIEDLNKVLQGDDFFTRMQDMAARTYRETKKAEAAAKDDKKTWKDEDDKQTIHDIQAFVRAGKLDDLRTIIDEMGKDMSDDDVESFVKATTHEVSEEEDKKNHDDAIDEQIAARQKRIDELNAQLAAIQDSEELFTEGGEEALSSSGPSMAVDTGGVSVGGAENTPSELDLYREASAKRRQELLDLIAKENAAIEKLKQDKESYAPHKSYDGPFVSTDGNRIKTPDEIRAEIKHNANEMHRKVDSYLESIAAVEEKTKGRLTKEQEDNLAYLHNVSKEKMVRFDKIMSGVRKKLPKKFLIKTDKTPEQLTEEYASSDLAFSKEHTPEGWVEVNTSMLDDANFGRFFMDTVMRGDNISTKIPEEKAEEMKKGQEAIKKQTEKVKELKKKVSQNKAEKQSGSVSAEREVEMKKDEDDLQKEQKALDKLTEQYVNSGKAAAEELNKEAEKEAKKQQRVNIDNMRDHFYETMRKNTNMTLEEIRDAFEDVKKDIIDAATLEEESLQFNATLNEYMRNPQKVEQAKKKEEKKAAEKVEKENAKKMTVRELSQRSDLKDLLAKAKSDNDVEMVNKIKRAMVLRKQQATMQNAKADPNVLKDYSPAEREAAFQAMQQKLTDELNIEDKDIDKEKEIAAQKLTQQLEGIDVSDLDSIIKQGLDPVQRAVMDKMVAEDPDAYLVKMEKLSGRVQEAADELQAILTNAVGDIDAAEVKVSPEALEAVEKAREGENPPPPAPPKVDDVVSPVLSVPSGNLIPGSTPQPAYTGIVSNSDILKADMISGTKGYATGSTGQHPWRSVTRRVGNKANKPYSEVLDDLIKSTTDENKKKQYEKQKIRTEAVEKFLEEKGAFTRVEKGEVGGTIKFKVFKAVNGAAHDFVIFMTDASGNVLADLPSSDSDIEPGTAQIAGLADFYEEARKQWDALSTSEQENPEGYMLKGLETKVNYTYIGKVRYLEERQSDQKGRQSVSSLFGDKEFLLGVKIREKSSSPTATIRTGKQNSAQDTLAQYIIPPLSGSVGQPYVLIPTSDSENKYSSERYMAVPILTPRFGEISKDSTFYKVVEDIINRLKDGNIESKDAKVLLGKLFSVSNIHINFGKEESSKGEGIRITTYSRPDGTEKVYSGTRENINTEEVLNALGRFQINISLSDINNNKEKFYTLGTNPIYYNSMIGEIATTNAAAPHTVNDFFTVVPLEKKGDTFKPVEVKPTRMEYPSGTTDSVFNVQVEYKDGTKKNWKIDPMQDFACFDDKGVAITKDDTVHTKAEKELAAQYRAEAYGRFYMKDFSKPFTVMFNDRAFVYYPATREFRTRATLEPTAPRYKEAAKEYDRLQELLDTMEEARQMREASKKPPVQPATPIEEQLIEHLKSLGFKVHNRAELEEYLNRNGETNIQEAVAEAQEMQEIRDKAIADGRIVLKADGTFDYALAPNGEKSNLNERQWLQVRTKAFKKWFGDWERVAPKNIKGNLINQNGEINWDYFEQILNNYHNSQPDSMFAKGRTTLATREEKHFEGEKNTLNHIKFVTQSMLNLFEGKFDADLPFVSEARASLQNQKDLMVLAAMFHDAAKPYRHGDIHGWESADILRDVVGIDYNNRLAEWAIRHHMAMPFSHKAEFNLSNPEAIEVARNMARDAKRIGIDAQTAINAFVLINAADIINGREITVEDNWAKKARAAGSTKFGDDISVKSVLTAELKEKVDLLKKAFEDIKDEDLGNPEQNYRNQSRFDYTSYPEGGRTDGKLPYLSNIVDNGVSKVVDENGEPLVVYHGSKVTDIRIFKKDDYNSGYYFTSDINYAKSKFGNEIYQTFLNIKNPVDLRLTYNKDEYGAAYYKGRKLNSHEQAEMELNHKNVDSNAPYYIRKGYDGIFGNDSVDTAVNGEEQIASEGTEYVVWSPNQIKSATNNIGTFSNEIDDIQMAIEEFESTQEFRTSQGEVYGFVDENGDIYLDETVIKPEHPIHEYTHIWDRALAKRNPALWRKGISLMKETSLWNEIANSPNYGKKWEAKEGMTTSKLEFLIASEVHARLVGKDGEQILNRLAQEKGQEGIIAKLKAWILEAWKALKQTFGNWTAEEIERLTLEDFKNMTVRDFADGVNLNEEEDHTAEVEATISEIQKESENYILCDVNGKENPEGNYYKDKRNGTLHARVTSMIEGDPAVKPFKETNDDGTPNVWITPSTTIGNQVDEFIRAFFEGVDPMTVPCPNLSDSSKRNLITDLQEIQKKLKQQGWEVASRNIMATGLIGVADANGKNIIVRTAGTLDLLLYNPKKGTYAIYDIKTHRGKVDDDKINKWTAQLSLYKQLLETKFPQLKGRISGMRIIPLTVDGYDAYKEDYHKEGNTLLNAANEPVITNVKYDGNTIPIKERNLTISMGKEGFKKEYNEEGKKHIIYEPRVKPGEGPKQRIKEGTIEAINKIPSDVPFELCVKEEYLEDETVQQLGKTIDEARKNNTLQDLVFTSDTIDLLSKIINDETVNNFAVNEKLNKEGLTVPPPQQPSGEEAQEDLDEIAKKGGFIPKKETPRNRELIAAWNSLSDENKKKVLSKSPSDFKDAVSATRQGGSINDVIDSTYHRKATESKGIKTIDLGKELEWLSRVLPQLSRQNKIKIVEGLIRCSDGTWDYGQLSNGILYVATNGKVGTIYHEAFHAVTQWILTDEQLDKLYEAARKKYGNLDPVILEEKLADDFMLYTMGVQPKYKYEHQNIFRRLWQAIKNIFKRTSMIDQLYRDINNGVYTKAVMRECNNEFAGITPEDREISMGYRFIDSESRRLLKENNISEEQYEIMDAEEKRYLFHCVI